MTSDAVQDGEVQLVVFNIAGQRCAVELERVVRVLRMVALTPLPQAPDVILGMFDLHGELLPVASVRRRFRFGERPVSVSDQLIVVHTRRRPIALAVDNVDGVRPFPRAEIVGSASVVPGLGFVRGVTRLPNAGLVLVQDIDAFLSLDEEAQTDAALAAAQP